MELDEYRAGLDAWLDEHEAELRQSEHDGTAGDSLAAHFAQLKKVKALAYDAGWVRYGWPEAVGGLGGSPILRAYLGEVLMTRDLVDPGTYSMIEVLVPTALDYMDPALAAEVVPPLLRGDEAWCQGFSEPSTGSNLGGLTCKASETEGGWLINGQKVWTSYAQYSQRCIVLTRTGTPESAHRGITAFFVDMDTPGITVRPLETMHGVDEFAEVFFDDVFVPRERLLGEVNKGWSIAMDLLPYERSTALWHRGSYTQRRLGDLVRTAPEGALDPTNLGTVVQQLYAFRARSRSTQWRLHNGGKLSSETSIDKVLLALTEQAFYDLAADSLAPDVVLGDNETSERWRSEFLYSRAATIYGGSYEIQRNIIARRVLDLGDE
jgi:alkylation response protein AidB-like acyl-CoA dehydrogenase